MTKPTQEQVIEFWEWCGVTYTTDLYEHHNYPPIDLNNLFKYALPKVEDPSISLYKPVLGGNYWVCFLGHKVSCGDLGSACGYTPALALFWAIWEVIKNE